MKPFVEDALRSAVADGSLSLRGALADLGRAEFVLICGGAQYTLTRVREGPRVHLATVRASGTVRLVAVGLEIPAGNAWCARTRHAHGRRGKRAQSVLDNCQSQTAAGLWSRSPVCGVRSVRPRAGTPAPLIAVRQTCSNQNRRSGDRRSPAIQPFAVQDVAVSIHRSR